MNLTPWRAKSNADGTSLVELRTQMDRLFDNFMRDPFGMFDGGSQASGDWLPAIDVSQTDQDVIVRAEVPGVDPKDLDISVVGNRLELAGEKKFCREHKDGHCHTMESRYGSFRRSVELPSAVDSNQVTAEHSNGVVTVKLHKTKASAAKRIPVKSG